MRRKYLPTLIAAAIALPMMTLLSSCSKDEGGDVVYMLPKTKAMSLTSEQKQMISNNNSFALNLFEERVKQAKGGESVFISPMGVSFMLGMIQSGADSNTQAQTAAGMGLSGRTSKEINEWCNAIHSQAPEIDKQVTFLDANAIYVNKNRNCKLQKDFTNDMQNYYDAGIEELDFTSTKALATINGWSSKHTEGMIPEILSEEEFNPDAVCYLLNAVYFDAKWTKQFDKANTSDRDFTTEEGTVLSIPTMHGKALVNAYVSDDYTLVCLPYGSGSSWNMLVVLPAEDKTVEDVATLLKGDLSEAMHSLSEMELEIEIPKFSLSTKNDLTELLPALGITDIFGGGITGMCKDMELFVSKMRQKAAIDVNEEGSKATAVTVAEMLDGANLRIVPDGKFFANRPFLFLITENNSDAIFFAGTFTGK